MGIKQRCMSNFGLYEDVKPISFRESDIFCQ